MRKFTSLQNHVPNGCRHLLRMEPTINEALVLALGVQEMQLSPSELFSEHRRG
jgi:hypothetical protein